MNTRLSIFVVLILVLAAAAASAIVYPDLPETLASHWNEKGEVNGYMPRFWGAFLVPLILAGMAVLLFVVPLIDPLKANIARFRRYYNILIVLLVVFMVYIHALTLAWNLGWDSFDMNVALLPAMGLLFIFIGPLIRNAKRNFFIGIRTPWTLSSDRVWDETHRLGGIMFIASGLLAMGGVFFGDLAVWFILVPVLASTLFLVVYSYVLYQREAGKK